MTLLQLESKNTVRFNESIQVRQITPCPSQKFHIPVQTEIQDGTSRPAARPSTGKTRQRPSTAPKRQEELQSSLILEKITYTKPSQRRQPSNNTTKESKFQLNHKPAAQPKNQAALSMTVFDTSV